jgi:hypothetical protein
MSLARVRTSLTEARSIFVLIHCCGVRRFVSEGGGGRTDDILPVALTASLAWHGVIHWDKRRVSSSDGAVRAQKNGWEPVEGSHALH